MLCSYLSVLRSFITVGKKELSTNALQKHLFGIRSAHTEVRSKSMVIVLNVAEKNDAARNLSEIMSRGHYTRREGHSKFNKIYQFDYHIFNQPCSMVMTSVSGHLLDLEFVGAYKGWRSCNPVALFEAPLMKFCPENYLNIKRTLEEEVRRCSKLIIWTDGDREGENIGFEIIDVCQKVKPNLPVYRARFSEITQQAVNRACQNLSPPDQNTSNAVYVRRELDLRIGAAFTRFQTLRLQKVFPEVLSDQLISYGSCQFPTLGFVVERYKQVQNFVPESFWKIKVFHKKKEISVEFSWKRNRLFEHLACLILHQKCIEEPEATVTSVQSKSKSKWRPLPLDTVELEKLASRKLRISAKETMSIAEKLYTQGLISYPRTETNIFPKDMDLQSMVQQQVQDPRWGEFAAGVLTRGPNPRQGTKSDKAHPPIHPIKHTAGLEGNMRTIYEFIVRHFLACVSQDAEGFETTVDIKLAEEEFAASGLVILARNYLDVYPYDKWSGKEIPDYTNGELFMPESIEMVDGDTTAPQLLTEADLISLMDKHGIGTDATHAEHIETIKSRLYVGLNNEKRFVPGELGMGLVEGYDRMGFEMSKPVLRSELESDLKRICEGTKNHQVVLQEQIVKYKEVFVEAMNQANLIDEALAQYFGQGQQIILNDGEGDAPNVSVMKCPQCGNSDMVVRHKRQGPGFFLSCMSYPQCKASIWFPDSVDNVTVHDDVCTQCRPGLVRKLKFNFKRGSFAPLLDDEVVKCIGGCDNVFMETLGIRPILPTANNNNAQPRAQFMETIFNGNGDGSRNTNRRNTKAQPRGPPARPPLRTMDQTRNEEGAGSVNCQCGKPSNLKTVNKDGPNKGREFYGCARRDGQSCNFFHWADALQPAARLPDENANNPADVLNCGCGRPASQRTVRKEGPNVGRQFYACSREGGLECNFFQWMDALPVPPQINNNRVNAGRGPTVPLDVGCNCDPATAAKLLKVQKEGPNKGRQFYNCSKPRDEGCRFFQWAEDIGPNTNTHPAANNNINRGNAWIRGLANKVAPGNGEDYNAGWNTQRQNNDRRTLGGNNNNGPSKKQKTVGNNNASTTTKKRAPVKCSICGIEGHNRKSCPNK